MLRGSTVTAPDGSRWRVGRRWMDRPLPNPRRRAHLNLNQGEAIAEGGFEALGAIDGADSPWVALALAAGALLFFLVLLPLLGLAFELIVVLLVIWSGIVGRVILGRPWIVEATVDDDPTRRAAFAVKGWRRSGRAIEELKRAIVTTGTPALNSSPS